MLKNCKLGILCLTETWLDSSITDDEIKVKRYNLIRKARNRKGGGYVFLFVKTLILM